jgi:hypothetical protein
VPLRRHRDPSSDIPLEIRWSVFAPVTVRWEAPEDHDAIHELEELCEARILQGTLLVAERAGRIVAALAIEDGRFVADPFVPTGDVRALLALRAEQVRPYLAA